MYNDEDFDGLVIKLPAFFIKQNKLEPAIKKLYNAISKAKFSTHIIGVQESLREIRDLETKSADVMEKKKEREKRESESRERQYKEFENIRKGIEYPVFWKQDNIVLAEGYESVKLGDKEYEFNKYHSRRGVFNKKFKDAVNEYMSKPEFNIEKFIEDNRWGMAFGCISHSFYKVDLSTECPIYSNAYLSYSIHLLRLYVGILTPESTWQSKSFRLAGLEQKDGVLNCCYAKYDLSGYKIDHDRMKLVKK